MDAEWTFCVIEPFGKVAARTCEFPGSLVCRADAGTRTPDPFITSEVLYQLSYVGDRR